MQISSRFTLAIHICIAIDTFKESNKVTSDFLASSTNVNPVIVRKLLGQLKEAGIVEVQRGTGGAYLAKDLKKITFLDIYKAVECVDEEGLFHFHENPNPMCPVGGNIHKVMDDKLEDIQSSLEKKLSSHTLWDVKKDLNKIIK